MPSYVSGFSNAAEAAILDNATVGLGRTLYLYLFKWTGTAGQGNTASMGDDGTRGTSMSLITADGPKTVASSDWASAVAGNPTTKSLSPASPISFTNASVALGEVCWWALSTTSGATITSDATWDSNKAAMVAHGPITDGSGNQTSVTVAAGETFQFSSTAPIKMQLGDPGVDTFS